MNGYREAAKLMALLMLVFSVAPLLAPLMGGLLAKLVNWQILFWIMAIIGLFSLGITRFFLAETASAPTNSQALMTRLLNNYCVLLSDLTFVGLVLASAFSFASFFIYISHSSFVFVEHYHLQPFEFSLLFSLTALSFLGSAQLFGFIQRRFTLGSTLRYALLCVFLSSLLLNGLFVLGMQQLWFLMASMMVIFSFMGIATPTLTALMLEKHAERAGTASALFGTLQFLVGATVMFIAAHFNDGKNPSSMIQAIGICAGIALAFCLYATRRHQMEVAKQAFN